MVPDIALAASAREWPDRLHRFLLDHGGGRIVDRVMGADQATERDFDILVIDDVCSFLSPRLVAVLKHSNVEVLGVYMPEDGSDAKRRLLECGISDVIETDATPEEFIAEINSVLAHRLPVHPEGDGAPSSCFRVGVTGPCEGVGMTEVAIALSHAMAEDVATVLVDLDQGWPSVAQRLDLPVHPNIRTAIDHALHRIDSIDDAVHELGGLAVVGGRADGGRGAEISRPDAMMLFDAIGATRDVIVADLGALGQMETGLVREFDSLIVVGDASPVGVGRLIRTIEALLTRDPVLSMLCVVNGVSGGSFRRSEIINEIGRAFPDLAVSTIPFEERLDKAAWDGTVVDKGRYGRAIRAMAEVIVRSVR